MSQQDYKALRVEEGREAQAIAELNSESNNGYHVVAYLQNAREEGVTTLILSLGQAVLQKHEPDSNNIHFSLNANIAADSLILVDLSDTVNYAHNSTNFVHLENFFIDVDAAPNADYLLEFGFLANVSSADGDFVQIAKLSSAKTKGAPKQVTIPFFPNGGRLSPQHWRSSATRYVVSTYGSSNLLKSTIDPTTATVNPGSGDLVLRVARGDTTEVNVSLTFSYHTA